MLHHDRVRSAGVGPTIQLSSRLTRAGLRDTRIILVAPPVWCRAWIGARFMWQSVSLDRGPQHLRQTGCQPQAQDLTEWDDERRERLRSPAGGAREHLFKFDQPPDGEPESRQERDDARADIGTVSIREDCQDQPRERGKQFRAAA